MAPWIRSRSPSLIGASLAAAVALVMALNTPGERRLPAMSRRTRRAVRPP